VQLRAICRAKRWEDPTLHNAESGLLFEGGLATTPETGQTSTDDSNPRLFVHVTWR